METVEIAKDSFFKEINKLLIDKPERWKSTTSKTCFMFNGKDKALTLHAYLDSKSVNCISIGTIDNQGNFDEKLIVNSKHNPDDYQRFRELWLKVKSQVEINIYKSLREDVANANF